VHVGTIKPYIGLFSLHHIRPTIEDKMEWLEERRLCSG